MRPCKIIIAGGGIGGLTLALIFDKLGIDYTLLEAYPDIVSKAGAGICMLPFGLRILDQLECYEELLKHGDPVETMGVRNSKGEALSSAGDMDSRLSKRYGYPMFWVDRSVLLQILYDRIQEKSRLLSSKRIENVEYFEDKVQVTTSDESSYSGDILIGADGVHSRVRKEILRRAAELGIEDQYDNEERDVKATFSCIFGLSTFVPGTQKACLEFVLNKGSSFIMGSGPKDRTYWFLARHLGQTFPGSEIPRFTEADAEDVIKTHWDDNVTPDAQLSDLYQHKREAVYTVMREIVYKKWHLDRAIVIGDAAHQMTSILGQGGSQTIESAAALANELIPVLTDGTKTGKPSLGEIKGVFERTQTLRLPRVKGIVEEAHKRQMMDSLATPELEKFMLNKFPGLMLGVMFEKYDRLMAKAVLLNMLPVPYRVNGGFSQAETGKAGGQVRGKL